MVGSIYSNFKGIIFDRWARKASALENLFDLHTILCRSHTSLTSRLTCTIHVRAEVGTYIVPVDTYIQYSPTPYNTIFTPVPTLLKVQ